MSVQLAEIRDSPLSVDEVLAAVSGPAYGGVAVFLGTVRNQDHDRDVVRLDYSAHPTAADVLRGVVEDVAARSPGVALAALHRVGELHVGEIAVIVGAAAAHRGEALSAARLLIDTIKTEVPLWKKQQFLAGDEEWVGACE